MQNDNTTTTARDLAQELRNYASLLENYERNTTTAHHVVAEHVRDHAADIAATLDALADENERLRRFINGIEPGLFRVLMDAAMQQQQEDAAREILKHTHSVPK